MKNLFIAFFLFSIIFNPSQAQTFLWVNNNTHNIIYSPDFTSFPSSADASGNFTIGTIFNFKLIYGDFFLGDVIIRKYNTSGTQLFSKVLTGEAEIDGIENDLEGNIYVHGLFIDTLRIDPSHILINTGLVFGGFFVKMDNAGNLLWSKNINVLYGNDAALEFVKVKGTSIIAGISTSMGDFIKKYNLSGNEQMSITITIVNGFGSADMDSHGNIYATGACSFGNINFGGLVVTAPNPYNKFFVKFNASGSGLWVKFVEDVTFDPPKIICDDEGNLYASGNLSGPYMFGSIHTMGPQWVYDFFLTKLDSSGTFLWVKEVPHSSGPLGDAEVGKSTNISIDNSDNIYLTGFLRGSINWGNITTTSSGLEDVLILKFNTNGNIIWGKAAGGAGNDRGDAISLDDAGNIYISGNFSLTASFDTITVNGTGNINSFSAKLTNPSITGISNANNLPKTFSLTNYPNPFNPTTKIKFTIPSAGAQNALPVKIEIFDVAGRVVGVLINREMEPGTYEIDWNADNYPSGVYLYRLTAGDFTVSKKMMLIK